MSKFLYLFRGGDESYANLSPEELQAHMQKWGEWVEQLSAKGKFFGGHELGPEGKQVKNSGITVIDGPFTEGKEVVGGYLLIESANMDEAIELSKGCPVFEMGGEVEIREALEENE